MSVVPAVRDRPYVVVGTHTMFLFWIVGTLLGSLLWSESRLGMLMFFFLQAAGFGLALLFGIWGADFERGRSERKVEMARVYSHKDLMIVIALGALLALALATGRAADTAEERSTYPLLIGVTFVGLAARQLYAPIDRSMILLWVIWSSAFLLFYGSTWSSEAAIEPLQKIAGVPLLLVLAYVFCDYGRRSAHGIRRTGLVAGLELIVVYFLLTSVLGNRIPHAGSDRLLRLLATLAAIVAVVAYWAVLSGRRPRWPWRA
jgi:hypothetical protein